MLRVRVSAVVGRGVQRLLRWAPLLLVPFGRLPYLLARAILPGVSPARRAHVHAGEAAASLLVAVALSQVSSPVGRFL